MSDDLKANARELLPEMQDALRAAKSFPRAHEWLGGEKIEVSLGPFETLIAILTDYIAMKTAPDPLGEALNSGDGSYRP